MDGSTCTLCCSNVTGSQRRGSTDSKTLSCAARRRRISYEKAMETNASSCPEIVKFGPMIIKNPKKLALFISSNQDKLTRELQNQLNSFQWDIKNAKSAEEVSEYMEHRYPNLIILDARSKLRNWDPSFMIRSLQTTNQKNLDSFILIAFIEKLFSKQDRYVQSLSLKNCGVSQVFHSATQLLDFLYLFDRAVWPMQIRLRVCSGLFSALDVSETAVEITDDNRFVQYVNPSYEWITGCLRSDVLGTLSSDLRRKSLPHRRFSVAKERKSHLIESQEKRSSSYGNKSIDWHCFPVPGSTASETNDQFIYYRPVLHEEQFKHVNEIRRNQPVDVRPHRGPNGPVCLETPFTEILSLLSDAQRKSMDAQDDKLHRSIKEAMKILSSAEVITPVKTHFREEDKVSADLFDGLIMNGPNRSQQRSRKMSLSLTDAMKESCGFGRASQFGTSRSMSPELKGALTKDSQWDFNIFELEKATFKRPLVYLGMKIFERWKVQEFLECSESCIRNWLETVESYYRAENPYHNAVHAADVLQSTACFLGQESVANAIEHTDAVAALLAAVIHDVDHPGKGSAFLIHTRHSLATLYNDVSVLENHHCAFAFQLCFNDSRINIFSGLPRQDYATLRKSIVDMVLATDMNRHFDLLAQFQQTVLSKTDIDADTGVEEGCPKQSICRILIKCADINNPTRPWHLCKEWAYRIVQEYFNQTAEERAKGLPLTMEVFDKETCNVPLTQCRFIDMFARDLFDGWCKFADMPDLLENLDVNYDRWQQEAVVWPQEQERFGKFSDESLNTNITQQSTVVGPIPETSPLCTDS